MQEEVEHKTVNLAVRSSKVTAQVLYKGLKAFIDHQKRKAAMKAADKDEPIKGEQSVKELIGQGQGVSSMPIGDDGIKDFKKNVIGMANRMLHIEDMYYFKDAGLKVYDWGGAGTAEDVAGITKFKKSFGGEQVVFYSGQAVNGFKAKAVNALSKMKHIIKK